MLSGRVALLKCCSLRSLLLVAVCLTTLVYNAFWHYPRLLGLSVSALRVSTGGECGAGTGFTCFGSESGDCCSRYGYW